MQPRLKAAVAAAKTSAWHAITRVRIERSCAYGIPIYCRTLKRCSIYAKFFRTYLCVGCCCAPLGGAFDALQGVGDAVVNLPVHGVFDEPAPPSRQEGEISAELQPSGVFGDGCAGDVIVDGDAER